MLSDRFDFPKHPNTFHTSASLTTFQINPGITREAFSAVWWPTCRFIAFITWWHHVSSRSSLQGSVLLPQTRKDSLCNSLASLISHIFLFVICFHIITSVSPWRKERGRKRKRQESEKWQKCGAPGFFFNVVSQAFTGLWWFNSCCYKHLLPALSRSQLSLSQTGTPYTLQLGCFFFFLLFFPSRFSFFESAKRGKEAKRSDEHVKTAKTEMLRHSCQRQAALLRNLNFDKQPPKALPHPSPSPVFFLLKRPQKERDKEEEGVSVDMIM